MNTKENKSKKNLDIQKVALDSEKEREINIDILNYSVMIMVGILMISGLLFLVINF